MKTKSTTVLSMLIALTVPAIAHAAITHRAPPDCAGVARIDCERPLTIEEVNCPSEKASDVAGEAGADVSRGLEADRPARANDGDTVWEWAISAKDEAEEPA
jgi:hypothetical protein